MEGNETLASLFSEGTESSGGDGGSEALSGGSGVIESGGYRVAKFDFAHISTPYVICMWILLASAMKVGYHHLHMSKVRWGRGDEPITSDIARDGRGDEVGRKFWDSSSAQNCDRDGGDAQALGGFVKGCRLSAVSHSRRDLGSSR